MATTVGRGTAEIDFLVNQGATFDHTLTWKSGGSPVDLTGYSARMQIRDSKDSSTIIDQDTEAGGNITITLGGTAGTIQIKIPATATDDYTFDEAVYDLELDDAIGDGSGDITRLVDGHMFLNKEVTR